MNTATETYQETIRAGIHAMVSADASDGLEIQAIQERIHQIYSSFAQQTTLQGTVFIKDYILSDITEKTLILFKNLEPSIYTFMLTKAVYLFTLGSKSENQIPGFFNPDTKERIKNQRRELVNHQDKESIAVKLREIMKDFGAFEDAEEEKDIKSALACLKGIAYNEIHNGLLATKCLMNALSDSKYQDI